MPTIFEGTFATPPGHFAIVAARSNQSIVEKLLAGALDGLKRHCVPDSRIDIAWVPGSFEIPLAPHRLSVLAKYRPSSASAPS